MSALLEMVLYQDLALAANRERFISPKIFWNSSYFDDQKFYCDINDPNVVSHCGAGVLWVEGLSILYTKTWQQHCGKLSFLTTKLEMHFIHSSM